MKRRMWFAYFPVVLLLTLSGFFAWLLHTESGARWAWARVESASGGAIQAQDVRGDVRSGMALHGVTFAADGTDIEAPLVQIKVDFDLFPPAVSIEQFDADRILIRTGPKVEADQPLTLPESLALRWPISFTEVHIGEIQVFDADQQLQFSTSELTFAARLHKALEISRAGAGTAGADWQLSGTIALAAPFAVDLTVTTKADAASPNLPALNARASIKGNLDQLDVDAQFTEPAAIVQGRISDALRNPLLELNLSAVALQWPFDATSPDVLLRETEMRVTGGLDDYELKASAKLNVIDLPEMAVQLQGHGNLDGLEVETLSASGEPVDLTATGTVAWGEAFRVALDTSIARLLPNHWIADWPQDQPLHGRLSFEWAGERVRFTGIDLAAGTSGFTLTGSGELDPAQDLLKADLAWSGLRWPLGAEAADFSSEQGQLSLSGSPSDWRASGALHLQAAGLPDGQVRLSGEGDRESARLKIEQGTALGGEFDGNLTFGWTGTQPWSTEIRVRNINLSAFGNGLPEAIIGEISADGQLQPVAFDVQLKGIRGRLRGQPLSAEGGITLEGNHLQARNLDIRSGESELSLDGNPEHPDGLRFSAHVGNFGAFFEDAGGTFDGRGLLSVNEAQPRLELAASGSDLVFGDWQIGSIGITEIEPAADGPGLRLDIADFNFGKRKIQEISLVTSGQNLFDRIRLHALWDTTRWETELSGDASGWPRLVASVWQGQEAGKNAGGWQGQIESWRIEEEALGGLQLEAAAPLSFGASESMIGPACLRGPLEGRICFDARLGDGGSAQANARLDRVSLSLLSLLTRADMEFTQTLTGYLHWLKERDQLAAAEVSIDISPGEIRFPDADEPLKTGAGRFAFRVSEGQLLEGDLDLDLPEAGRIDTSFGVPDISKGANAPVEGRIRVELSDIGPMMGWAPELDRAGGSVEADVTLSGSLAEPRFTGHASLVRGHLEHRATGTVLTDIQLAGAVYQFDHAQLDGSFKAGEGEGRLKATLQFDEVFQPEITLDLAGKNLTLLNVPDLQVVADPDLQLYWHDSLLKLNGEILIPRARLSPRYIPTGTVNESADLVIVAGALPPEEKSVFDRSRLRLNGTVGVALGDDVSITLDRAKAKLSGKTVFTWKDSLIPMADGHYTVSGRIAAYGQLLEVTEGRIGFPNIPADNPQLDIRAEREIYGNVQVRKAGVLLSGTLRRPILETYTTPRTTAERALTLLVTGHDFDSEQGTGGVEVGMYIAPKLYVSYGIGLFENQSVISARYEIKGGFGIKATSGQRETGADVSYTIER